MCFSWPSWADVDVKSVRLGLTWRGFRNAEIISSTPRLLPTARSLRFDAKQVRAAQHQTIQSDNRTFPYKHLLCLSVLLTDIEQQKCIRACLRPTLWVSLSVSDLRAQCNDSVLTLSLTNSSFSSYNSGAVKCVLSEGKQSDGTTREHCLCVQSVVFVVVILLFLTSFYMFVQEIWQVTGQTFALSLRH